VRFEDAPWTERLDRFRLIVVDNPRRSPAQALALNIPTIWFWNPAMWKSRPIAAAALDALRRGGILHDDPESAAAKTAEALKDPAAWWRAGSIQQARAEFIRYFAKNDPGWAGLWIKAAQEI